MPTALQVEIPTIVEPFARVIDGRAGTVGQTHLDDLKTLYDATDHSAYRVDTYQPEDLLTLQKGALFHLPFRLALGLHSSVEGILDEGATTATFSTYESVNPLMRTGDGYPHEKRMRNRAESAVCGAIIEAATDRQHLGRLREAYDFLRQERLVSRASGKVLERAVELVSRT